jgi:hypothetical protein
VSQVEATPPESLQKEWWLRVVMVLQSPVAVFRALRDDSPEASAARQEPVLLLVLLAGIAAVLSFSATTGEFLNDPSVDWLLVAVLAFLGGGIYGFAGYWLGGVALMMGVRGAKGESSYRQARHLLAYALAPLALSLVVVWPIRLAVFGEDTFRTGGADEGTGELVFSIVSYAFAAWSIALLTIGVREVHGWTTIRAIGAVLLTVMALLGLAILALVIGRGA